MSDKQIRLDGGSIDGNLFDLRIEIIRALGIGWDKATEIAPDLSHESDLLRILEIPAIDEIDPHILTKPEHFKAILWTAEVAGQPGPRAVDLALIHIETDGEIELFFRSDKYARETFDVLAPMDEWDSWLRPSILNEAGSPGDNVLIAATDGGKEMWFDIWGHESSPDRFSWVEGCCEFEVLDPENHPVQVIHHDLMYEHTDPLTIVSHEGTFKFASRGGVMWERFDGDEPPAWAWEAAKAKYNGELKETGFKSVSTGWHSSMERSEQSRLINQITRGDFHKESMLVPASDLVDAALGGDLREDYETTPPELEAPVMVSFGGTGNVCSIAISIYAQSESDRDTLARLLDGKRATPGYAGVN